MLFCRNGIAIEHKTLHTADQTYSDDAAVIAGAICQQNADITATRANTQLSKACLNHINGMAADGGCRGKVQHLRGHPNRALTPPEVPQKLAQGGLSLTVDGEPVVRLPPERATGSIQSVRNAAAVVQLTNERLIAGADRF